MKKRLKDHFIPHEGNGYKPNSLQAFSVGVMFLLILLTFAVANVQSLLWVSSEWLVSTILPSVIVELTNEERVDEELYGLMRSTVLDEAARLKAEDMAKKEYFSHDSPEGLTPWYWFDVAGYRYIHAGENLAVHFADSADVVEGWMNSEGHRANILNGNYTEIGVGTAQGEYQGYPTVYVVQLFGAPAGGGSVAAEVAELPPSDDVAPIGVSEPEATEILSDERSTVASAELEVEEQAETPDVTLPTEEATTAEKDEIAEDLVIVADLDGPTEDVLEQPAPRTPVFSDFASSTRAGTSAITDGGDIGGTTPSYVNWVGRVATQPNSWLQAFYGFLALVVFVSLVLSIAIEWRRQHPVQIAYGTGLIAAMAVLMYVQSALTSSVLIF